MWFFVFRLRPTLSRKLQTINCKLWTTYCLLLVTVLLMPGISHGQNSTYFRKHLEHYEDKPIHYGFLFALPLTRFNVTHNDDFLARDTTARIYGPTTAGFRVGFVVNAYLDDRWDIRSTPGISLYDRVVEYQSTRGTKLSELREATWVEVPLLLKYKSQRRGNSRMYMIAGMTFGFEANARRRLRAGAQRLSTKSRDLTIDYGFGFEQFLAYTKFSPEIRFSHGIGNLFEPSNTATINSVRRLTTHTIGLYLMFE
ncbi:MAG: PorT family protein [Spirosomaceae bacterium]|nr:PorT family protein [Spirosomataceae bacterium]